MDSKTIFVTFCCLVQNTFAVSISTTEYPDSSIDLYNAALAAQVAENRAAIAGTLAQQYGSKARAETSVAKDLARKAREKAYLADFYKKRAKKLDEQAKIEEKSVAEDKQQAQLLEENTKVLKAKAREMESKAKIKENLALEYRSKAKEQLKEAQLAESASKEAKAKAEAFETTARDEERLIVELEKQVDYLTGVIMDLRNRAKEHVDKANYEKATASNQLQRSRVYKTNAGEYDRVATETMIIAKQAHHLATGLHIQAEEERNKIKVEDVKAKYDSFIVQMYRMQANDNKHFAEQQLKDSKFYGSRAEIAKARARVYQKTAQEVRQAAIAGTLDANRGVVKHFNHE